MSNPKKTSRHATKAPKQPKQDGHRRPDSIPKPYTCKTLSQR